MKCLLLAFLATLLAPPAAALAAPGWTPVQSIRSQATPSDDLGNGAPRAGVAADGTAVVAYRQTVQKGRREVFSLRAVVSATAGRMSRPQQLADGAFSAYSAAAQPGGGRLVAYSTHQGLRAASFHAGRWQIRRITSDRRSDIDTLQAVADPRGGWLVVVARFTADRRMLIEAQHLSADGRPDGALVKLGGGDFGDEARPVFAIAFDPQGRAVLAYRSVQQPGDAQPAPQALLVRARAVDGTWSAPVSVPGLTDARVAPRAGGGALVAATKIDTCGDRGCLGAPRELTVEPDGTVGPQQGPALAHPSRAFGPQAVPLAGDRSVLVGSLKATSSPFSPLAPVAGTRISGGTSGTPLPLTDRLASEPVALPLSGDRGLAMWAGARGWGAATFNRMGHARLIRPPVGPPPSEYHFNETNRDVRAAGRHVVVCWERGGVVRIATRVL